MNKIRIIVNGAQGKMGTIACQTLQQHPDFELVAALSRQDPLAESIQNTQAQVVVDLTRADCVLENTLTIIQQGAHPVIGTSGLQSADIKRLQHQCEEKKLGGIIVPNFSISAVLLMRFAGMAARYLPNVEIIEAHHPQKLDAPSGTALKTADVIAAQRQQAPAALATQALIPGALGANYHDVPIHSIRLPGILAQQDVLFGHLGETLTLRHQTIDRQSFMPGLVMACQAVSQLQSLYYGLEHLLD